MFLTIIITTLIKILVLIHQTKSFAPISSKMFYAYQRSLIHNTALNNFYLTTFVSFYEAHTNYSAAKTGIIFSGIVNNKPNQCSFSFDSTIVNSTAASLQVYFPFAANIVEITLTLIISYPGGTNVFEIANYSFTEVLTSNPSAVVSTQKNYTTLVASPFTHAIFLRSFNLTQSTGNNLSITINDLTVSSTNPIKYNYQVDLGTTIRQIAVTIIVYRTNLTSIATYSNYSIYTFSYNTYNNNFNNVNIFLSSGASYGYQGKCLVGHKKLNFNSNFAFSFKYSNATFNYTNVANFQIWMFCIVENYNCALIHPKCVYCKSQNICTLCYTSYIPVLYTNYSSKCQQCHELIPGCLECFTSYILNQITIINCTRCSIPTYLFENSNCSLCNQTFPYCVQCTPMSCSTCVAPFMLKDGYCKTCTQVIKGCVECISTTQCTKCYESFVLWEGQCKSCHTCYGCVVFTINTQGDIKCLKCNSTMFLQNPVHNLCVCRNGTIQNRICNTDSGCIAPYLLNGVVSCLFCNFTGNFKMQPGNNGFCQCQNKYVSNGNGGCIDLCGDGFLMLNQTNYCDDGNLVSGDGCSSTCSVEIGFRCRNGNAFTPSACIYLGFKPYIKLKNIERVLGSNTGSFQFKVEPALSAISKLNMMNSLIFNCPTAQYTVINASQKKGLVTVSVDFSTDLEGLSCNLTLNYNQNLVGYQNSVLNFQVISRNIPLIVSYKISSYMTIEYIFDILSYTALGLFIISLGHKMIGAEILLCGQMVYLSNCFNDKSSFMMSSLKSLKLVTGGWSFFRQESDKQLAYPFSDRIDIGKRFLQTNIFVVCVMLFLSLVCIVYLIYRLATRKKKINQIEVISISTFTVYRHFLMPICASFMLILFISGFISQTKSSLNSTQIVPPEVNSIIMFLVMSICGMVAAVQIYSTLSKTRKGQEQSLETVLFQRWYPSLFLLQIILLSLLIQPGIKFNAQTLLFFIFCLKVGYLILLLIKRPYKRPLDMVNIVTCQVIVLYALCINMVKNYIEIQQVFQVLLIFILEGLIVICYIMALARLIVDYYPNLLEMCNKIREKCFQTQNSVSDKKDIQEQKINSNQRNLNQENVGKEEVREFQTKKYNKYSLMNLSETNNMKIEEASKNKDKPQLNISKINEDGHLYMLKEKLRQNLFKKKTKK